MIKGKTYRYDDEFKAKAHAHQFAFREYYWCDKIALV